MEETILYTEDLPGGAHWSGIIRRHRTLRLIDEAGGANVALMAYHAAQPLDRLNLPDTLKAQHTAKLTRGHVLMSDMGHVLLSIVTDQVGWHDPLGGHSNANLVAEKYGERSYQEARNAWTQNAHDGFLIELGKYGLGARDLVANVNFFSRLDTDDEGRMTLHSGNSHAGAYVDLRAEMDVLVVLDTNPHPLDPVKVYSPLPVRLAVFQAEAPGDDDYCRGFRPENARAFTLTERFYA